MSVTVMALRPIRGESTPERCAAGNATDVGPNQNRCGGRGRETQVNDNLGHPFH